MIFGFWNSIVPQIFMLALAAAWCVALVIKLVQVFGTKRTKRPVEEEVDLDAIVREQDQLMESDLAA